MYISLDLQEELLTGSCQRSYWTDGGSCFHPHTSLRTCKRNFSQDHASAVTEQTKDLFFIHIHLVGPARGTSHRIMPSQLLNRHRISSSSAYISSDLQEELLTGSCQRSYWTDIGSHFHPHTSRWTCKRNFSQDHASAVTEQKEDLIFIHIHLVGPTRGTSHRIMPPQLLNRRRISSSSTYISSDLQKELQTARSCQPSYWTDGGSRLHPHTSRRTCKRNFSQDHASAVIEQKKDLVFIHIQLVRPARRTSHRIMPAQSLNRRRISSHPYPMNGILFVLSSWLSHGMFINSNNVHMNMGFHSNL